MGKRRPAAPNNIADSCGSCSRDCNKKQPEYIRIKAKGLRELASKFKIGRNGQTAKCFWTA